MEQQKEKVIKDVETQKVLMQYTAELICSQLENRDPEPIPEGISIDMLAKIAVEGQVKYLIFAALLKLPLKSEDIMKLRPEVMKSTMRTLNQVCELRKMEDALEKEGVNFQTLKGSVLKFIYPRPEMREMGDVDIMIYGGSLEHAEKVLKELGYETKEFVKHHLVMYKLPYMVAELHWTLYDQNVDKTQFAYFNNEFRCVLAEGKEHTYEFTKEDFYVYMIAHMAKHFYENGCGIRTLLDIYVYRNKYQDELDENLIQENLKKCGLVSFEEHMRKLAYIWLEQKKCSEFYLNLFAYMMDCGIYGKGQNGIWGRIAQESSESENKDLMKLKYYFPSLKQMKQKYTWLKKYPFLLPVAWIIRAVRGLKNEDSRNRKIEMDNMDAKDAEVMCNIYRTLQLKFEK